MSTVVRMPRWRKCIHTHTHTHISASALALLYGTYVTFCLDTEAHLLRCTYWLGRHGSPLLIVRVCGELRIRESAKRERQMRQRIHYSVCASAVSVPVVDDRIYNMCVVAERVYLSVHPLNFNVCCRRARVCVCTSVLGLGDFSI